MTLFLFHGNHYTTVFEIGGREYLHKLNNLDDESIINNVKKILSGAGCLKK